MTTVRRAIVRIITVTPEALSKGLLLGEASRTVTVMPSGFLGKLDVVVEQTVDIEQTEKAL